DRIACRGLTPDLTLVVDIDTETGFARALKRNTETGGIETRLDQESLAFHRKVRAAYHQLAEDEPRRVRLINGARPAAKVAADVWTVVEPVVTAPRATAQ